MEALLREIPILPAVRVLATATSFPLLAGPGAPRNVRLVVALALAFVVVPASALVMTDRPPSPMATVLLMPFEIVIGLAIGFFFSLLFHLLGIAGDFLGQEMGLNSSSQLDPTTGRSVPLLARLFEAIGLILFVELGGLEIMLRSIQWSFEAVPPGAMIQPDQLAGTLATASLDVIGRGIGIALPGAILLLVLTMFTTIAARVLPKLHIFDFAFALRMLAAIVLVSLILPRLVPAVREYAVHLNDTLRVALVAR